MILWPFLWILAKAQKWLERRLNFAALIAPPNFLSTSSLWGYNINSKCTSRPCWWVHGQHLLSDSKTTAKSTSFDLWLYHDTSITVGRSHFQCWAALNPHWYIGLKLLIGDVTLSISDDIKSKKSIIGLIKKGLGFVQIPNHRVFRHEILLIVYCTWLCHCCVKHDHFPAPPPKKKQKEVSLIISLIYPLTAPLNPGPCKPR